MGREGEDCTTIVDSLAGVEDALEQHNASKRAKRKTVVEAPVSNVDEAKKRADAELARLGGMFNDNFHVAVVFPFHVLNEDGIAAAMEPYHGAVESAAIKALDAAELNVIDGKAECARCGSTVNLEAYQRTRPNADGICPICRIDTDDGSGHVPFPKFHYLPTDYQRAQDSVVRAEYDSKVDRLSKMLTKIGKRNGVQSHGRKRLFNNLTYRPLFKQPAHSNALDEFKDAVKTLLPALEKAEAAAVRTGVKFLVATSWLSSHDEWQDNSDMDDY